MAWHIIYSYHNLTHHPILSDAKTKKLGICIYICHEIYIYTYISMSLNTAYQCNILIIQNQHDAARGRHHGATRSTFLYILIQQLILRCAKTPKWWYGNCVTYDTSLWYPYHTTSTFFSFHFWPTAYFHRCSKLTTPVKFFWQHGTVLPRSPYDIIISGTGINRKQ